MSLTPAADCKRPSGASLVLLLLVISAFINYIDRGNLSIAASLLKDELRINAWQLGVLFSSFFWSYTLLLFVWGWLLDRWDVHRVLALGFLIWSLATAVTGLVRGFTTLLLMRLMLGVGESVAFPSYSKIFARDFSERDRGFANGAICAAIRFGPAAGTLGAGWLIAHYGWRPVFVAVGLLSLPWLPVWMKATRHARKAAEAAPTGPSVADILRLSSFWATAAGSFCCAYALYFTITWLPFYLQHELRMPMTKMVRVMALYYVLDGLSALATGWFGDLRIRRGASVTTVRKAAMAVGWISAAIGFLGCCWSGPHSYLAWLLLAAVGCGAGLSGQFAFSQTFAGTQAAGRWVGLQNGLGNLAGALGPALTGLTVDRTGRFQLALTITAGVCLAGSCIWVLVVPRLEPIDWRPRVPTSLMGNAADLA